MLLASPLKCAIMSFYIVHLHVIYSWLFAKKFPLSIQIVLNAYVCVTLLCLFCFFQPCLTYFRSYGVTSMCMGTGMGAAAVFEYPGS